ncbi:hypothetical protein C7M84_014214 [Penaeus vannamei]|uniref:Crustacean hyperglycemic hormone n=1 Tax=Penaeus vannamei TaxID=6689 RepID=A0A3R7LZR3_PENVA|nr:hypothetical protein C7M84_014214 [Penaeus vannamei]
MDHNKIVLVSASILVLITVLVSHNSNGVKFVLKLNTSCNMSDRLSIRRKRQTFDASCKGVYDRRLWTKLNRLCLDCQNIYRKDTTIERDCRKNCFGTEIFYGCILTLNLPKKYYLFYADLLRE